MLLLKLDSELVKLEVTDAMLTLSSDAINVAQVDFDQERSSLVRLGSVLT